MTPHTAPTDAGEAVMTDWLCDHPRITCGIICALFLSAEHIARAVEYMGG